MGPDGRLQGDALVVLEGQMDLNIALKHHNQNMGRRYIEVMPIGKSEVDHALSRQPGVSGGGEVAGNLERVRVLSVELGTKWRGGVETRCRVVLCLHSDGVVHVELFYLMHTQ